MFKWVITTHHRDQVRGHSAHYTAWCSKAQSPASQSRMCQSAQQAPENKQMFSVDLVVTALVCLFLCDHSFLHLFVNILSFFTQNKTWCSVAVYKMPQYPDKYDHSFLFLFHWHLSSLGIKLDAQSPCIRCPNIHRQIWSFILVFISFTSFFTGNKTWCSVAMYKMPQCTQINMITHSCLYLFTSNLSSLGIKLDTQL